MLPPKIGRLFIGGDSMGGSLAFQSSSLKGGKENSYHKVIPLENIIME